MHAAVRFVGLTGSTEVGKILYGRACIGLKKLGLELAPFVEFEAPISMPPSRAPSSPNTATWTRPADRLYAQASIYEEFVQKLSTKVAA
ncbi:acyl-CoA reductase-like NAD-dependent aldehyde dehydrogenase [Bradyrhizobium sp. GM2.4]